MTAGEFGKLIEAAMVEADQGGLSEEEQILVLELIVRSKREDLVGSLNCAGKAADLAGDTSNT
jgi:hypothetical protein